MRSCGVIISSQSVPSLSSMVIEAKPEAPVLVVDDDPKIQALVRAYLQREGLAVVTASDGTFALEEIRRSQPQLVVLDLMLPGLDGMSVLRQLRQESDVPVLILSARGSTPDRVYGITEGADDYLPKPFSPAELVARVRTILRRTERATTPSADEELVLGDLIVDASRHEARVAGRAVALSALELRLLWALLDADGRALTRDQLLDAIHGAGEGDALDRAIDVYVKRLREKLGDDPITPRYVATVRGVGYRAVGRVERLSRASRG